MSARAKSSGPSRRGAWVRLYAAAMVLYPAAVRRREGPAMLETFVERLHDTRDRTRGGRPSVPHFAFRELGGLLGAALRERWGRPVAAPFRASRDCGMAAGGAPAPPDGRRHTRTRGRRAPLRGMGADLRDAVRSLAKSPGATALTIVTLTLGIGANAAMFSVVNAVLLRPLPYPQADRLVRIWPEDTVTKALDARFRDDLRSYEHVSAFSGWLYTITGEGEPEMVQGAVVGPDYFEVIGVPAHLGRTLDARDSEPGNSAVVVLAHGLWQRRFAGDPAILGREVEIGNEQHDRRVVVGVLPPGHRPLESHWELWTPLPVDSTDEPDYYGSWYLSAVGRLGPGATAESAQAELRALLQGLVGVERYHLYQKESLSVASVTGLHEWIVGPVRTRLLVLLGAVGAVLLIACTNVANLLLARASERREELAIRAALGAGRWRIARQLLTESVLLAFLGGAAGLGGAMAITGLLRRSMPADVPRADGVALDVAVLAYTAAVAVAAAIVFGTIPAWKASSLGRTDRPSTTRGAGGTSGRLHRALIVAEVSLSCVLVVCAGLLVRSLWEMGAVRPGFDAERVITMRVAAPRAAYSEPTDKVEFHRRVLEGVRTVPGVSAAGAIHLLPLRTGNWSFPILPEGFAAREGEQLPVANFRVVTPGYFRAMGIPVMRGRVFDETDRADSAGVTVINQQLADAFWPGEDPVGRRIDLFGSIPLRVIGIVGDVRQHRLVQEPRMELYRTLDQYPLAGMVLAARVARPVDQIVPGLRDAIRAAEPEAPISELSTMDEVVSTSLSTPRFSAALLATFATLAVGLGVVGVYGVMSYAVSRRRREIGIRMALGARDEAVLRSEIARGASPVLLGIAIGLGGAFAGSRLLESLLFRVTASDPGTYLVVAALLVLVAIAAAYVPARRASRLDPLVALRLD